MIKIFITVRNRLAITKKCIYALRIHSKLPHQIYVYDNQSNYLVEEHFEYFCKMYMKKYITQVTFTTEDSTFNAFSKASTCNFFGKQHEMDPKKDSYDFLVILDNDIIVTPGWDLKIKSAWNYVKKHNMNNIKVIGQLPGGIKQRVGDQVVIGDMKGMRGKLGGSGLWAVRTNFFRDIGFLDLKQLVGHDKKHDQLYWRLLELSTHGKPYILGLREKLGIHCGKQAGSVCNRLTRNRGKPNKHKVIYFEEAEKKISKLKFNEFYNGIVNDRYLMKDW
jgi:hypothetical protein